MAQVSPLSLFVAGVVSLAGCYSAPSMDVAGAASDNVWTAAELNSASKQGDPVADATPEILDLVPTKTLVTAHKLATPEADETSQAKSVPVDQAEQTVVNDGVAKVVLPEVTFDFGTMEPFQARQHTFVIRNEGSAPLRLEEGQTSCKCTLGKLAQGMIPPGGETTVTLQWRSASGNKLFAHEAEILTNDPENRVVVVRVKGRILSSLFADPETFALPGIYPGTVAKSTVVLASQQWASFEINDIKSSLDDLRWEITPLSDKEAAGMNVKSGHRVTITLPDDLPRGFFNHWLRVMIDPQNESPRLCEIPINGNVLRRVSIYGEGIDSTGLINLGKVWQGRGLKKYFTVKVRDSNPTLEVETVDTDPDFLGVTFQPLTSANKPGLYRMCVEIPVSAPRSVFMGQPGSLHVSFANPRFEDLNLKVQFAIMGDGDF